MSTRRLNIVFLAPGWPPTHPAGSEVMGQEICKALVAAGHTVTVSNSRRRFSVPEYELDGVRVLPFESKSQDIKRCANADIIFGHLADAQRAAAIGARYRKPSIVITHNSQDVPRGTTLCCFNSEWLALDHGYKGPQMILRPRVPIDEYATQSGDHYTLINANPSKGIHQLIALADRLPDIPFLVVEGAYGGAVKPEPRPNITWMPLLPPNEMRDKVYAQTRVLLMPSKYESWGRTAVEAMASGIPVIAHPTPGLLECLGSAGIFADRDDLDAWVTAIKKMQTARSYHSVSRKALIRAQELNSITSDDLAALVDLLPTLQWRQSR